MRLPQPAQPFRGHYESHYGDRIVEQLSEHVWRVTCFHPVWTTRVDYDRLPLPVMHCDRCGASDLSLPFAPTVSMVHTANVVDAFLADLQDKT